MSSLIELEANVPMAPQEKREIIAAKQLRPQIAAPEYLELYKEQLAELQEKTRGQLAAETQELVLAQYGEKWDALEPGTQLSLAKAHLKRREDEHHDLVAGLEAEIDKINTGVWQPPLSKEQRKKIATDQPWKDTDGVERFGPPGQGEGSFGGGVMWGLRAPARGVVAGISELGEHLREAGAKTLEPSIVSPKGRLYWEPSEERGFQLGGMDLSKVPEALSNVKLGEALEGAAWSMSNAFFSRDPESMEDASARLKIYTREIAQAITNRVDGMVKEGKIPEAEKKDVMAASFQKALGEDPFIGKIFGIDAPEFVQFMGEFITEVAVDPGFTRIIKYMGKGAKAAAKLPGGKQIAAAAGKAATPFSYLSRVYSKHRGVSGAGEAIADIGEAGALKADTAVGRFAGEAKEALKVLKKNIKNDNEIELMQRMVTNPEGGKYVTLLPERLQEVYHVAKKLDEGHWKAMTDVGLEKTISPLKGTVKAAPKVDRYAPKIYEAAEAPPEGTFSTLRRKMAGTDISAAYSRTKTKKPEVRDLHKAWTKELKDFMPKYNRAAEMRRVFDDLNSEKLSIAVQVFDPKVLAKTEKNLGKTLKAHVLAEKKLLEASARAVKQKSRVKISQVAQRLAKLPEGVTTEKALEVGSKFKSKQSYLEHIEGLQTMGDFKLTGKTKSHYSRIYDAGMALRKANKAFAGQRATIKRVAKKREAMATTIKRFETEMELIKGGVKQLDKHVENLSKIRKVKQVVLSVADMKGKGDKATVAKELFKLTGKTPFEILGNKHLIIPEPYFDRIKVILEPIAQSADPGSVVLREWIEGGLKVTRGFNKFFRGAVTGTIPMYHARNLQSAFGMQAIAHGHIRALHPFAQKDAIKAAFVAGDWENINKLVGKKRYANGTMDAKDVYKIADEAGLFGQADFLNMTKKAKKPQADVVTGKATGRLIDDYAKFFGFAAFLKSDKPKDVAKAMRLVGEYYNDYRKMSPFEKKYAQDIASFYNFMRFSTIYAAKVAKHANRAAPYSALYDHYQRTYGKYFPTRSGVKDNSLYGLTVMADLEKQNKLFADFVKDGELPPLGSESYVEMVMNNPMTLALWWAPLADAALGRNEEGRRHLLRNLLPMNLAVTAMITGIDPLTGNTLGDVIPETTKGFKRFMSDLSVSPLGMAIRPLLRLPTAMKNMQRLVAENTQSPEETINHALRLRIINDFGLAGRLYAEAHGVPMPPLSIDEMLGTSYMQVNPSFRKSAAARKIMEIPKKAIQRKKAAGRF